MMKFQRSLTFVVATSRTFSTSVVNQHIFDRPTFNGHAFGMVATLIFMRSAIVTVLTAPPSIND